MKRVCLLALSDRLDGGRWARKRNARCAEDQRARRDIFEADQHQPPPARAAARPSLPMRWRSAHRCGFPAPTWQVSDRRVTELQPGRAPSGNGIAKPILLLSHMTVVEAKRGRLVRGPRSAFSSATDFSTAGGPWTSRTARRFSSPRSSASAGRLPPNRDLILALTDRGGRRSDYNGVQWLLENHRAMIDAAYVINMDAVTRILTAKARVPVGSSCRERSTVTFKLRGANPVSHARCRPKRQTRFTASPRHSAG